MLKIGTILKAPNGKLYMITGPILRDSVWLDLREVKPIPDKNGNTPKFATGIFLHASRDCLSIVCGNDVIYHNVARVAHVTDVITGFHKWEELQRLFKS